MRGRPVLGQAADSSANVACWSPCEADLEEWAKKPRARNEQMLRKIRPSKDGSDKAAWDKTKKAISKGMNEDLTQSIGITSMRSASLRDSRSGSRKKMVVGRPATSRISRPVVRTARWGYCGNTAQKTSPTRGRCTGPSASRCQWALGSWSTGQIG